MNECTARSRLLNVGYSGLRWCCNTVRLRWGSGSLLRSLGRSLVVMRKHDSASSYLSHFGRRQNATNTLRPLPRKNSLNNSFFFFWRRNIFLKRYIFDSFRVGEGKRIKDVAEIENWSRTTAIAEGGELNSTLEPIKNIKTKLSRSYQPHFKNRIPRIA